MNTEAVSYESLKAHQLDKVERSIIMSTKLPLVSIVALSYNQEEYVVDSLNSILSQDYSNIELIICDDSSTDKTISLIQSWISNNRSRFVRLKLITSSQNVGICKNLSAGLKCVKGYWIKPMACDDILQQNAISQFVEYAQERDCELVFSQLDKFIGNLEIVGKYVDKKDSDFLCQNEPEILLGKVVYTNIFPAPSAFYSRRLLECAGGIDTDFQHLDDWPLWLRMLPKISNLGWIEKSLVLYRLSEKSLSQSKNNKPIRELLYRDQIILFKKYQIPLVDFLGRWHLFLQYVRRKLVFEYLGNNWMAFVVVMPLQLLSPRVLKSLAEYPISHMRTLFGCIKIKPD